MPSRPCANPWKKAGWPWPGLAATPCFQAGSSWWPPPTRVPVVPRLPAAELLRASAAAESSAVVRTRVLQARVRQEARRPSGPLNGALSGAQLRRDARLDDPEHALLEAAADRLHL